MNDRPNSSTNEEPEVLLVQFFQRNGYVRTPNEERRQRSGSPKYKKGYEIRFVVRTRSELAEVRRLLRRAGFKPGRSFRKHSRYVQPIYGKRAVERFLALTRRPDKS